MKSRCLLLMLIAFSFVSFVQAQKGGGGDDFAPFKENVAITEFATRNLPGGVYVREIKLVDFSGGRNLPAGFGFLGTTVADNGQNNDKVAGDGIYTSVETYAITDKQARYATDVSVPASNQIVTDNSFRFDSQLGSGEYERKIKVKCRIYKCGCPCNTFTCNACEWFGWSCIAVEWCEIELEW